MNDITNAVYLGAVKECERREYATPTEFVGNGHHMAQNIVGRVAHALSDKTDFDLESVLVALRVAVLAECEGRETASERLVQIARTTAMADQIVKDVTTEIVRRKLFE